MPFFGAYFCATLSSQQHCETDQAERGSSGRTSADIISVPKIGKANNRGLYFWLEGILRRATRYELCLPQFRFTLRGGKILTWDLVPKTCNVALTAADQPSEKCGGRRRNRTICRSSQDVIAAAHALYFEAIDDIARPAVPNRSIFDGHNFQTLGGLKRLLVSTRTGRDYDAAC